MTLAKESELLPRRVDLGRRRAMESTERIHYCSERKKASSIGMEV